MCTHLDKTGSTYYFRRLVPKDLLGYFTTATGNPRTEWKRSLGTKDREKAKRLIRPHTTETDALIDDARTALAASSRTASKGHTETEREREEQRAQAALEAASAARREARAELRMLWRQRRRMATAELSPDQAAAVDLIRERDAELDALRSAVAVMEAGVSNRVTTNRAPTASSLHALFDRYAASGAANPKTVRKWRARLASLVSFLGHENASRVSRADLNRWIEELVTKGLAKKTIVDGYLPAVRVALAIAHDDGVIATEGIRELGKRTFNRLLNRDKPRTSQRTKLRAAPGDPAVLPRGMSFAQYRSSLCVQLQPIQKWFGTGEGVRLQREDSDLAIAVMTTMEYASIPVIPIHDSFLAPVQHKQILRDAMQKPLWAIMVSPPCSNISTDLHPTLLRPPPRPITKSNKE